METERCPHCGGPKGIPGRMVGHEGFAVGFAPLNVGSRLQVAPPIAVGFHACLDCGHLWATVDPSRLRDFIAANGKPIARQELDELDRGPYRGLPDTTLAREIGDKVAELDALARRAEVGVVGRYREMTGLPWDQALKDAGRWRLLGRDEKLALFGWTPKKKATFDDLDAPFP